MFANPPQKSANLSAWLSSIQSGASATMENEGTNSNQHKLVGGFNHLEKYY